MITIKIFIGTIASVIGTIAVIPYIRDIFLRKTEPHVYTWLIWSLLQGTSAFIMLYGGAGISASLPFAIWSLLCGYIFILSFKYGTKNITLLDTICLIGALIALVIYVFLHNPLLSIIFVCVIDLIGFIPTLRKSYTEPKTETASTYILSAFSTLLIIIALFNYSLTTILYPITLILTDTLCGSIIILRRKVN